ncbi:hypothetical protein J155_04411 [Xanthomonas citri pv. citri]|nr:hypothetical protein J151_04458 [Xanthomonas citri subsp. citri A306]AJY84340.1 hypothetical protein J159_04407 [Xanthomonas citri pv. citri]AJY88764.1 hypothetical protein J158_04409 [Xanthomonas citri subsp. citri UI6]AJY93234.1 hypothetical protein J169_04455 [Xanthomonas citri pv. citri]AJY97658.1 hypothetical protein J164_04408 [Xanthomonas citri pv. citri]
MTAAAMPLVQLLGCIGVPTIAGLCLCPSPDAQTRCRRATLTCAIPSMTSASLHGVAAEERRQRIGISLC